MLSNNSMENANSKLIELWHKAPENIVLPLAVIFFTVVLFLRDKIIH